MACEKPYIYRNALTVITRGRLDVFGPAFGTLIERKVIENWLAIPLKAKEDGIKWVGPEYKSNIVCLEEKHFDDEIEAKDYIRGIRNRFSCFDFGRIFAAEKHVSRYFPNGIIDMADMLKNLEEVIKDKRIDLLLLDFPASSLDMAAYQLLKSKGIPTILLGTFRIRNRNFFCYNVESGIKEYIHYHYRQYLRNGLPEESRFRAKAFLEHFRQTKYKPPCLSLEVSRKKEVKKDISLQKFISFSKSVVTDYGDALSKIRRKLRKYELLRKWYEIFSPLDERDRIIFFPMQFQPEASTYVRSPYFKNQYSLIENLCVCVPGGWTVYVKEHPLHLERIAVNELIQMKKRFPNLKFVDMSIDSHDIIQISKLVIVLTSSAGWEAFLYGVPVIAFGAVFFAQFNGVYSFEGFPKLRDQIERILKNHQENEKEILTALAASYDGTLPGYIDDPRRYPEVLSNENLIQIADLMQKGIEFFPEFVKMQKELSSRIQYGKFGMLDDMKYGFRR